MFIHFRFDCINIRRWLDKDQLKTCSASKGGEIYATAFSFFEKVVVGIDTARSVENSFLPKLTV